MSGMLVCTLLLECGAGVGAGSKFIFMSIQWRVILMFFSASEGYGSCTRWGTRVGCRFYATSTMWEDFDVGAASGGVVVCFGMGLTGCCCAEAIGE